MWLGGKEPACQCRRRRWCGFDPWVGKIPWRRKWQPTPVSLPGEIQWTAETGGLQSIALQRVRYNWVTEHTQDEIKVSLVFVLPGGSEGGSIPCLSLASCDCWYSLPFLWCGGGMGGLSLQAPSLSSHDFLSVSPVSLSDLLQGFQSQPNSRMMSSGEP